MNVNVNEYLSHVLLKTKASQGLDITPCSWYYNLAFTHGKIAATLESDPSVHGVWRGVVPFGAALFRALRENVTFTVSLPGKPER